jgi:hypothetical protein
MNYLEYDQEMDEVFRRVSGFYSKNSKFTSWERKLCTFQLKEYKWVGEVRSPKGEVIAEADYDMS